MDNRDTLSKHKRKIQQLEEKLRGLEGHKRFDPSKAFKHDKENSIMQSPLRDTGTSLDYLMLK